jgi:hypothetical protein
VVQYYNVRQKGLGNVAGARAILAREILSHCYIVDILRYIEGVLWCNITM